MNADNVQTDRGVTLVGGGTLWGTDLADAMALAPVLVAADGGADACVAAGVSPVAVIGDMDSVGADARNRLTDTAFIEVAEQDSTDFEKCLTRIVAPFTVAVGFTGARVDHTLAVLSTLPKGIGPATLVLGREDVIFAAPMRTSLDLDSGTRVSLFPMAPLTGRSEGLEWPIEGLALSPMGRIGTSNRATGPVTLEFDRPGCLVIMPRAALPAALRALVPDAAPEG